MTTASPPFTGSVTSNNVAIATFPKGVSTRGTVPYYSIESLQANFGNFYSLPNRLQGMDVQVIYISPKGQLFHLHGKNAGMEGVRLNKTLQGEQHWPFELVLSKGAYVLGADIEKVNINERIIQFGVIIGGDRPHLTPYQYHLAEEHWWNGQDENQDGWLGIFTRFSGWRWIKVRPDKTVTTAQTKSPTSMNQNTAMWDITWIAAKPYYSKVTFSETWQFTEADFAPNDGLSKDQTTDKRPYKHTFQLANRGDLPSPVKYIVSSPGQAAVSDNGVDNRMVPLPVTVASDGPFLVDTEDGVRTITSATERVDNFYYQYIRSSTILDYLLGDLASTGLPLGYGFDQRFMYTIAPQSIAYLTVEHSNPDAVISCYVPQRYKRSL